MQEKVKIAVDAMGGDNAPHEIIKGAVEAVKERKEIQETNIPHIFSHLISDKCVKNTH